MSTAANDRRASPLALPRGWLALCVAALVSAAPRGAAGETGPPAPTLALAGDVLPDGVVKARVEARAETRSATSVWRELFAEVAPALSGASLAVVNLETPVSPRYLDDSGPGRPVFNAPEELLDALAGAGVDVLTLANNHAYDQGFEGLRDTMAAARRRGLSTVGAGPDGPGACGPTYREAAGFTVGLCSWTEGSNRQMPLETEPGSPRIAFLRHGTMERCLGEARRRSKLAVAAIHWSHGAEPWDGPSRHQREVVRRAAEAGADLVVGHGPHVPGPAGRLVAADGRRVTVVFSLGNLLGAMGQEDEALRSPRPTVRDAPVVLAHTRRLPCGRLEVSRLSVAPFWIADPMPIAPWWTGGGQPLVRPVSVDAELRRLARASCGRRCEARLRAFERRAAIARSAVGLDGPPPSGPSPRPTAPAEPAVRAAAPGPAAHPAPVVVPLAAARPPVEDGPPAPEPEREGRDGLLARLLAGAPLPLRFRPETIVVDEVDQSEVERVVRLLLVERRLRVHLTGCAEAGEDGAHAGRLARRRALAAMHLLAARGPSRARFFAVAAEVPGSGRCSSHVFVRLEAPGDRTVSR